MAARDEPRWHPLLATDERTPGVWTLVDSMGRDYGTVRIMRAGDAVVYVCELRGERLGGRTVTLREAVERVHMAFIASHGPGGAANGGRGYGWDDQ